jgi:Holliday junction resolvase RusA-like endonuclease
MGKDTDNILKLIMDAMHDVMYTNDNGVVDVFVTRKFAHLDEGNYTPLFIKLKEPEEDKDVIEF